MRIQVFFLVIAASLLSCTESNVSYTQYNQGRVRAEMEGCHCNSALSRGDGSDKDQPDRSWANGYIDACIAFRKDLKC